MNTLVNLGEGFINIVNAGAENLIGLVVGLIPTVIVTLTFMTAVVKFIGEERVERIIGKLATGNALFRYTLMPFLAVFFFSSPAQFLLGKYLPEKYKAAYYEAVNCLSMAPLISFFPHVNAAEAFVFLGIAQGVEAAGYSIAPLATATFFVGIVTTSFRSFVVDKVNGYLADKKGIDWDMIERRKAGEVV